MNTLFELFCMPTAPSLDLNAVNKAGFEQLMNETMASSSEVMRHDSVRKQVTSRVETVVGGKSHSRQNTMRTIKQMFEAASSNCQFARERDLIEWLHTCVSMAVDMGLREAGGSPAPFSAGSPSKADLHQKASPVASPKPNTNTVSHDSVVPGRYQGPDDDYEPSDPEDAVVPVKNQSSPRKGRKPKHAADELLGPVRPRISAGAGSGAVVKYFTEKRPQDKQIKDVLPKGIFAEAYFFPSKESFDAFISVLDSATSTIDICVFSLTDDDVADALIAAKKRQVKIRIITDNQQAAGKGADAARLQSDHGIPYKTDNTTGYMHNKFAIIDHATLINGSFNWSKGARFKNRENILVTNIPQSITQYERQFEALWAEF